MIDTLYHHLKSEGLNPYLIGQHVGECEKPFVIIKEGTQIPSLHSRNIGQQPIDMILFLPVSSYKQVAIYRKDVIGSLKNIKHLRKTGTETPPIVDDEKKAYTMSIEYVLQKKLEG